jgi:hypothetical protein
MMHLVLHSRLRNMSDMANMIEIVGEAPIDYSSDFDETFDY